MLINLILAVRVLGLSWSLEELVAEAKEVSDISSNNGYGKAMKWSAGSWCQREERKLTLEWHRSGTSNWS
jgi:hypothetical protein